MDSATFINTSVTTSVESWFIPFDIFSIICTIFVIGLAILYLLIIIFDKTCHTVPMMLIANSCLAELMCGSVIFAMNIFTVLNDLQQSHYQDSLCVSRGYFGLVSCAIQNYSFVLQAIYRYTIVIYPHSSFWKSMRTQLLFISLTWIIAFAYPFPFIFTGEYIYDADNQLCKIPLRLSFSVVFTAFCVYMMPVNVIMFIHSKLVRYVKEISNRATPANTLLRAQRELKMVRRIVLLTSFLVLFGLPYGFFAIMSFFTRPPKYHFRIVLVFIDTSLVFITIALFQFTDALRTSVKKILTRGLTVTVPALA
jgi:hypothetical protein